MRMHMHMHMHTCRRFMRGMCTLRVSCGTQARLREACKPDPEAPGHDSSSASDATSGEEGEEGPEGDLDLEEGPLDEAKLGLGLGLGLGLANPNPDPSPNQASQPPLDGSGFAFVRSLFGGSAIRARPESALPAHAWPTRTPSESQMRAAV